MNILKILFLLPLSILCFEMTAQIDDLLKNKDITWIAETYNDFVIDESFEARAFDKPNHVIPLKFVNNKNGILEERFAMQEWLEDAIKSGKLPVFDSEFCTKRRIPYTIMGRDSLFIVDPITYEKKIHVTPSKLHFERIPLFRAKQIIYYNAKKGQFGMRTLAVAPTVVYKDYINDSTTIVEHMPLFWFIPKDLNKAQPLSKKNITWARQMSLINGLSMSSDSVKVLKNTQGTTPAQHLLTSFEKNPKMAFYKKGNAQSNDKIPFQDRKVFVENRDTIVHWVDNVEKPQLEIVNNDLTASALDRLQLLQNWYWNSRKKRLEIRLVATAPMKNMAFAPDYLHYVPVFYRRTDD